MPRCVTQTGVSWPPSSRGEHLVNAQAVSFLAHVGGYLRDAQRADEGQAVAIEVDGHLQLARHYARRAAYENRRDVVPAHLGEQPAHVRYLVGLARIEEHHLLAELAMLERPELLASPDVD